MMTWRPMRNVALANHRLEATGMSAGDVSQEHLAVVSLGLPVPQPYR
jgi:DNA-binding helix-hairpin-helix protein with protein kinase domain